MVHSTFQDVPVFVSFRREIPLHYLSKISHILAQSFNLPARYLSLLAVHMSVSLYIGFGATIMPRFALRLSRVRKSFQRHAR